MFPFTRRAVALGMLLILQAARLAAQVDARPADGAGMDSTAVFVANRGQWDADARFMARLSGADAWVTDRGIVYDFHTTHRLGPHDSSAQLRVRPSVHPMPDSARRDGQIVRMEFAGGFGTATARETDRRPGYHNYMLGTDPSRWASNVPLYARVSLANLYPGVDAVIGSESGALRYDLVVAPHASPNQIALRFTGADGVELSAEGDLIIRTSIGAVRQRRPVAYQEIDGRRIAVPCSFAIEGDRVAFRLGAYDRARRLVIDPLTYSTYLGGEADQALAITADAAGNVLVTGYVWSGIYPTTAGAYSINYTGRGDLFVTKLNAPGTSLIFSTYVGGNEVEYGEAIAIGPDGGIHVNGGTASADFPTTPGAFDRTFDGGNYDVIMLKLNSTGTTLMYSTYLGGTGNDLGWGLAVDPAGNAYVGGYTTSAAFPTTPGAFDRTLGGAQDAFVVELNSTGTALLFSTFLGGAGLDQSDAIGIDSLNNVYVSGQTSSADFPTTVGAFDPIYHGNNDGFALKLNVAGTALLYSTYIGGSGEDQGACGWVDPAGNFYIAGLTASPDFPTTPGAFDSRVGDYDPFAMKLNPAGTAPIYSTVFGGSAYDVPGGLIVDRSGNAHIGGSTLSADFPTTGDAHSHTAAGLGDVFVTEVNATGTALLYSTYLGGSDVEYGYGTCIDPLGGIYMAGSTASADFPVTPGAYQTAGLNAPSGPGGAFVTKICRVADTSVRASGPLTICDGDSVVLAAPAGAIGYRWSNGATTRSITVKSPGTYSVLIDNGGCSRASNVVRVVKRPAPSPTLQASGPATLCQGDSLRLTAAGGMAGYRWSRADTTRSIVVRAPGRYWATLIDSSGCRWASDSIDVTVVPKPSPTITAHGPLLLCSGDSLVLEARPDSMRYLWSTGDTARSITVGAAGTYSLRVTTRLGCAVDVPPVVVTVRPAPVLRLAWEGPASYCAGDSTVITATAGFRRYAWSTGDTTPRIAVFVPGVYTLAAVDSNGCTSRDTATVPPRPRPSVRAGGPTRFCFGGQVVLTVSNAGVRHQWSTGDTGVGLVVRGSGRYWAIASDTFGCTMSSDTVDVVVDSTLAFAIDGPASVCAGTTATYRAAARSNVRYAWSIAGTGTIASGAGTSQITVQWGAASGAKVLLHMVDDATGCTADTAIAVAIGTSLHPPLVPSRSPSLCSGDSITLDAGDYIAYAWSTGATTRTITVSTAGRYWAFVHDAGGCSGRSDTVEVTVAPSPSPAIAVPDGTVLCSGRAITLDAGPGYTRYQWSTGAFTPSISVDRAGAYSVVVTDANGCTGSASVDVTGLHLDILPAGDVALCEGDSVELRATPGYATYAWSNGSTDEKIVVKIAGTYSVIATSAGGCADTSLTARVALNPKPARPVITANGDTLRSTAAAAYQWLRDGQELAGATMPSIIHGGAGSYTVRITDANGCTAISDPYGERARHVWLDTLRGRVGESLQLALNVAPPLAESDGVTGYRVRLAYNARSLYIGRALAGEPTASGDAVSLTRDADGSVVIELAPGAALRGTQLFRLEMYGLVTAVAENVMRLDSVELYGAGSPAHADGLVLLEGCDVGRDRVFDKAVTITSLRPHPVEGQATVGYWSASGSRPRLVLRDAMGREALAVDLPPGEGSEREATVSTVNLPSGLYRLELRDRGEVSAVSVLVVH